MSIVLAAVHLLAVASPGPNVIASITNSITHSGRAGVLTSLGIAIGNIFHIALGILGIAVLMDTPYFLACWRIRRMVRSWAVTLARWAAASA